MSLTGSVNSEDILCQRSHESHSSVPRPFSDPSIPDSLKMEDRGVCSTTFSTLECFQYCGRYTRARTHTHTHTHRTAILQPKGLIQKHMCIQPPSLPPSPLPPSLPGLPLSSTNLASQTIQSLRSRTLSSESLDKALQNPVTVDRVPSPLSGGTSAQRHSLSQRGSSVFDDDTTLSESHGAYVRMCVVLVGHQ